MHKPVIKFWRMDVDFDLDIVSFCAAWNRSVDLFEGKLPNKLHISPHEVADYALTIAQSLRNEGFVFDLVVDQDLPDGAWFVALDDQLGYGSDGV